MRSRRVREVNSGICGLPALTGREGRHSEHNLRMRSGLLPFWDGPNLELLSELDHWCGRSGSGVGSGTQWQRRRQRHGACCARRTRFRRRERNCNRRSQYSAPATTPTAVQSLSSPAPAQSWTWWSRAKVSQVGASVQYRRRKAANQMQ